MSRMLRIALIGLATSAVACGSSTNGSATRTQAMSGECTDANGCDGEKPSPPNPGPALCAAASLSVDMCLDYGTLERMAALACESRGSSASVIAFTGQCDTSEPQPGPPAPPGPKPPTSDSTGEPDSAQTDPTQQPGGDDGRPPTGGLEPKPDGRATGVKFACCPKPPPPPPYPCDRTTNSSDLEKLDPCPGPTPPVERCMALPVTNEQTACTSKVEAEQQAAAQCAARNFTFRSVTLSPCGDDAQNDSALVKIASVVCCDAIAQPQSEDPSQKPGDEPGN